MGFGVVIFADDNFNPATKGRIEREQSPSIRRMLENNREERMRFFDPYYKGVPNKPAGFTQMTSEIVSDPEYLKAVHDRARVTAALVGIESFTEKGLKHVRKSWNKKGEEMLEVVRSIEAAGISVLASIIFGLPSDTPQTARTMRDFVVRSGATAAQFTLYSPFLGTVDTTEMLRDRQMRSASRVGSVIPSTPHRAKHAIEIVGDPSYRFWLDERVPRIVTKHPTMSSDAILGEIGQSWNSFYSLRATAPRTRLKRKWSVKQKICFFLLEQGFKRLYGGYGISADSVSDRKMSQLARSSLRIAMAFYNFFFRQTVDSPSRPAQPTPVVP